MDPLQSRRIRPDVPKLPLKLFALAVALLGTLAALRRATGPTNRVVLLGLLAALAIFGVQVFWRRFAGPRAVKSALCAALLVPGVTMIFLLPPFQGPDEIPHWKAALSMSRADPLAETALYNLSDSLDSKRLAFHVEIKMDPARLRNSSLERAPEPAALRISYTNPLSYPAVALVAAFFPRVTTLDEALLFYYLCRALPLVALLALLLHMNRRHDLPYTAWFLFGIPLVVQQSVVVTTDTLVNLGTVAAVALFLHARAATSRGPDALLWLVCLLVSAGKPVAAGVLLLPLSRLPWGRVPRKSVALPAAAAAAVVLGSIVVHLGMGMLRRGGGLHGPDAIEAQLAGLATTEGVAAFARSWSAAVWELHDPASWANPLGWLDTYLSPRHLALIRATGLVALALDAWTYAPRLAALREKKAHVAWIAAVTVAHAAFLALTMGLLLHLTWNLPGAERLGGLQARYFFPCAILALLLPLSLQGTAAPTETRLRDTIAASAALGLLPLLLFARNVELAVDLLVRYW